MLYDQLLHDSKIDVEINYSIDEIIFSNSSGDYLCDPIQISNKELFSCFVEFINSNDSKFNISNFYGHGISF